MTPLVCALKISGELLASLKKYPAIRGIAAIVSQYRAIWGHESEEHTRDE